MSTIHLTQPGRVIVRRPLSAMLLAASLAIVAACGLTVARWSCGMRYRRSSRRSRNFAGCAVIPANSQRLACYDEFGREAPQAPAKLAVFCAAE